MSEQISVEQSNNTVKIKGPLVFKTVMPIYQRLYTLLNNDDMKVLDLQGVERGDSAGLALLIALLRSAKRQQRSLCFLNIPENLLKLAFVNGIEDKFFTVCSG